MGEHENMTRKEAALFLRVSERYLRNDAKERNRKIPFYRVGSRARYRIADLRRWLERHAENVEG